MTEKDQYAITTIETHTLTPDAVEAEAKRFATKAGGHLLILMAESGINEKQLAEMMGVTHKQVRYHLLGEGWRAYMPLAALCLALKTKIDRVTEQHR